MLHRILQFAIFHGSGTPSGRRASSWGLDCAPAVFESSYRLPTLRHHRGHEIAKCLVGMVRSTHSARPNVVTEADD